MKKTHSGVVLAGLLSGALGLGMASDEARSQAGPGAGGGCSNNVLEVWGHGPSHKIDRSGVDDDIKINIAGHVRKAFACVSLYETTGCDLYRNRHGNYTKETHISSGGKRTVYYPKSMDINGMRLGC